MQNILEKLYGGRISPSEQSYPKCTEYKEVVQLETDIKEKLKLQFDEQQNDLFDKYLTAKTESTYFEDIQLFTDLIYSQSFACCRSVLSSCPMSATRWSFSSLGSTRRDLYNSVRSDCNADIRSKMSVCICAKSSHPTILCSRIKRYCF